MKDYFLTYRLYYMAEFIRSYEIIFREKEKKVPNTESLSLVDDEKLT